jgi:ribosomal subunit interface protein
MRVELTARNYDLDDKVRAYVEEKLGNLDKYLPRHVRGNTICAVILTDDPSGREDNRYVCEGVVSVDGGATLVSREGTINIFAAIDIVEAKLKAQMAKYKDKHTTEPRRLRMLSRWRGRGAEAETAAEPAAEPGTEA